MKKKKGEEKKMTNNQFWYVSARPWKECPFKFQLIIFTKNGEEEAKKIFKDTFKMTGDVGEKCEIEDCNVVVCVKGEIDDEEAKDVIGENANA
jgi:hypothetical protein